LVIDKITNIRFTYQLAEIIFPVDQIGRRDSQANMGCFTRSFRYLEAAMFAIFSFSWSGMAYAGSRLAAAVGSVARRAAQVGRAIKNRRAATALAGLDDHMLADIGITRSDLRDAYSEPLWHDPTDVLVGRVAERRTRRRSALVHSEADPQPAWLRCETATCS
jgi:uncharacterized protein YjiS (DUF1127 family)